VRQLQRDVKLHFQVRDWEHAVSLLYELVELEPGAANHHGMLARAMARHPVMRKDAERHFIEALRLAPQDAELHFSLGLYYKSFNMHARAQTEFRTALRIRPEHEGAKKHLSPGAKGGKDPLKDMFKKIFG
jgi:tetratricopeptide (TPR) repeat protein